ncbi:MAG TPA: hypothetical protein VFG69_18150 [Nannocystaceae bacterium]|nr:hypothetical protein [Nannocystaceae bacterium]
MIEAIGIITRDRPGEAAALAHALAQEERARGRRLPVLVADDSRDGAMNEALAREIAALDDPLVRVVGAAERARVGEHLIAHGCDPESVEFAIGDLFGLDVTPGANRNFVRLLTGGRSIAVLDDDVRPRGLRPPDFSDVVSASRTLDPNESWFFDDRDAFVNADWVDLDIVGELDRALVLPRGSAPPLALAGMGLAGDIGSANAVVLLAANPSSRARLMDPRRYEFVRRSRIVLRTVRCPIIGDGGPWNPAASAYAAEPVLPPFFPVLRGQGPLFGATIRCGRAWSTVRLPWALQHRVVPDDDTAFDRIVATTARPGAATFIHMLVATSAVDRAAADETLVEVGRRLMTTGELPFESFKDVLAARMRSRQESLLKSLRQLIVRYGRTPEAWAADVDGTIAKLAAARADPTPLVPHDLDRHEHPFALMRELVRSLGRLYAAWPQMMAAARSLPWPP